MAGLVPLDRGWRAIAAEGGHTSLSPHTEKEMAAWQFLQERYGRVSVERVLSGPGVTTAARWTTSDGSGTTVGARVGTNTAPAHDI